LKSMVLIPLAAGERKVSMVDPAFVEFVIQAPLRCCS
jgi:hypothetical protein